jgi:hypothetical protein
MNVPPIAQDGDDMGALVPALRLPECDGVYRRQFR